ncbi:baculoviral IAP repeat-containing protein 5 isoform X1 [Peromyscus californicus insignis]|uniref:baculoviral IAP repeat-containing protein 5 isoform X1 n=1 Tax=Peromyscus californicus insignis TaxID=564181 RepID=UPI0022A7A76D|nr:baculoviral IAP repeat-containing protein 5 isoform X1 [Peromyscus californicus insignis]
MEAPALPATWQLYLMDHRISTFKNWPFLEGCSCTPERMAEAGFIHCPTENEPDLAQCFFCFKELEGWEPDDNPIEEHKKHSPGCAFLTVKKQFEELTLSEFLKLDKERAKNKIARRGHQISLQMGKGDQQQAERIRRNGQDRPPLH